MTWSLTQILGRVFDSSNNALKVELISGFVQNLTGVSVVDLRVAVFDGTSGLAIKDGGYTIAEILAAAGGTHAATFVVGGTVLGAGTVLDVQGPNGGVGFPSLTDLQRNALTPRNGVVIWNSDNNRLELYNGGWSAVTLPPYVDAQEIPVDSGDHQNFTLSQSPVNNACVKLFRNGVFLRQVASAPNADQYTISDKAIALGAALNADQIGGLDAVYLHY